jgi:hypothetical protein
MKTKILLPIVIALVIIFSIFASYFTYVEARRRVIQYVDDCESALLSSNRTCVICCADESGKLYLCNDKRVFKAGEYIGLQINLQKLNKYFDKYYACAYSNFPTRDTPLPEKYDTKRNIQAMNISGYESFVCSKLFLQLDYHHTAGSGYVEPIKGEYTLAKIWLFPEGDYKSTDDFKNNIEKAKLVFELEGSIE